MFVRVSKAYFTVYGITNHTANNKCKRLIAYNQYYKYFQIDELIQ